MRTRLVLIGCALAIAAISWWLGFRMRPAQAPAGAATHSIGATAGATGAGRAEAGKSGAGNAGAQQSASAAPTAVYAHNLLLHKGPSFRIYILWLRGQMLRTEPARNPSFDDVDSFLLDITKGVIHVRLEDLARFLNAGNVPNTPLTHVTLTATNGGIELHGTAHKLIPLPVELAGGLSVTPDNRVRFHVEHLGLLKIPLKGLLGKLHITLADLVRSGTPGVQIAGNDVVFDTQVLLPAPHIRGALTGVRLVTDKQGTAIEAIYGGAKSDPTREQQWHNFLQLSDGTLDFGKLTMHHVDLIMVDASKDPWFDLDLSKYQAQLVNGITRMTPQAGLQIFMPDLDDMPPQKRKQTITMEWLKDRNLPPPPDIPYK